MFNGAIFLTTKNFQCQFATNYETDFITSKDLNSHCTTKSSFLLSLEIMANFVFIFLHYISCIQSRMTYLFVSMDVTLYKDKLSDIVCATNALSSFVFVGW